MANHGTAKLPWSIHPDLMELFAKASVKAAFGGFYVQDPEYGSLGFKQFWEGSGSFSYSSSTQVWSDGPTHLEMRHGGAGLDWVAQAMEFNAIAACFGAPTAWDDGDYALESPGILKLLPFRRFCDGFSETSRGSAAKKAPTWLLSDESVKHGKAMLDPIFFSPPDFDAKGAFQPGPKRDEYLRLRETDVFDWGSKLDWAGAVESAYPGGSGLDARMAGAALLPSAALGLTGPSSALAKASVAGLERALSLALCWERADAAKEIHSRLCEISKDPNASESKALELCSKFFAKKAKASHDVPNPDQEASAKALHEAICVGRVLAKPEAQKAKSKRSI